MRQKLSLRNVGDKQKQEKQKQEDQNGMMTISNIIYNYVVLHYIISSIFFNTITAMCYYCTSRVLLVYQPAKMLTFW